MIPNKQIGGADDAIAAVRPRCPCQGHTATPPRLRLELRDDEGNRQNHPHVIDHGEDMVGGGSPDVGLEADKYLRICRHIRGGYRVGLPRFDGSVREHSGIRQRGEIARRAGQQHQPEFRAGNRRSGVEIPKCEVCRRRDVTGDLGGADGAIDQGVGIAAMVDLEHLDAIHGGGKLGRRIGFGDEPRGKGAGLVFPTADRGSHRDFQVAGRADLGRFELLGICFWREGRGNPGLAEYMGEKGGFLTGSRYSVLRSKETRTEKHEGILEKICGRNLKTSRAWAIKESFVSFWQARNKAFGEAVFRDWYNWAIRSQLKPVVKVAKMLKKHLEGLLSYFAYPITNAVSEGLNSKIQSIKSAARGFRNFANYRIRILLLLGICFWREGRGNPGLAEYMGEKGG